ASQITPAAAPPAMGLLSPIIPAQTDTSAPSDAASAQAVAQAADTYEAAVEARTTQALVVRTLEQDLTAKLAVLQRLRAAHATELAAERARIDAYGAALAERYLRAGIITGGHGYAANAYALAALRIAL